MKWRKRGLVYVPDGAKPWARTHAFLPTPELTPDGQLRVYLTSLDDAQFGRASYVVLDRDDPTRVLYECQRPLLDVGELGAFDDSGVNPSSVLRVGDQVFMYYIGWQRVQQVPYMLFSGLAISDAADDLNFQRASRVPVLDRTEAEPFSRSAPFVLDTGDGFLCWYWSCERWSYDGGFLHYNNEIRLARSIDGKTWNQHSSYCLGPDDASEYSTGRPWVVRDGLTWKMWYSIRSMSEAYQIGYAESADGVAWTRKDAEAGLNTSESGWDSDMVFCPAVIDVDGRRLLFYNGNRHGATGFGVAELERD